MVMLGNLSVRQLEERCGITLGDKDRETLEGLRWHTCDEVEGNNRMHIYDMPFMVMCGNPQARRTVIGIR